jgi:photosystem II stability/assembly factor-like uncharacterized protein
LLFASIAVAASRLSAADSQSTLVFIEDGQPKAAKVIGKPWVERDGWLVGEGSGTNVDRLVSPKSIIAGDFHVKARLAIDHLDGSAASFRMGSGNQAVFGFEGAHGKMYVAGQFFKTSPRLKSSTEPGGLPSGVIGDPGEFIADGRPFDLEVIREGDQLRILIDGRLVRQQTVSIGAVGPVGSVPIRSTMRVKRFSAQANVGPFELPKRHVSVNRVRRITIHPSVTEMPHLKLGPFVRLSDGAILTTEEKSALVTRDDGRTWTEHRIFADDEPMRIKPERVLMRLRDGTILLVMNNWAVEKIAWDYKNNKPLPEIHRPTYAVRSFDEGRTWQEPQLLYDGYCGALRDAIQTRDGTVVVMGQELMFDEARHAARPYISEDDGATWTKAKHLDMQFSQGDHAGTIEGTLEQLADGRLWALLRTYHGHFYESFSDDDGHTWTLPPVKSSIRSTGSPGLLQRLASGRLVLFWNAIPNEGYVRREELSVAFSNDEGRTWTRPLVIAKNPTGRVSYPYVFEYEPGTLWVTTMQGRFRGSMKEHDLYEEAKTDAPQPAFYKSKLYEPPIESNITELGNDNSPER